MLANTIIEISNNTNAYPSTADMVQAVNDVLSLNLETADQAYELANHEDGFKLTQYLVDWLNETPADQLPTDDEISEKLNEII